MDTLLYYFNQFNAYTKANPVLAGVVSLWGLGVVTWICRGVPRAVWGLCKRQFTTSLTFTSDEAGSSSAETFANFMRWFQASRWAGWSRSISILPSYRDRDYMPSDEYDEGTVIGVGVGDHLFFYRGWPFWLQFSRVTEGGNMYRITYEVKLVGLGRSRQRVLDLIGEFRYRPPKNKTGIYRFDRGHWRRACDVIKRPLETVVIAKDIKDDLLKHVSQWLGAREWYEQRGLAYKLTCVLRGLPGTGKTSLIKALAGHFNMNVCSMNLAGMSDISFEEALNDAPKNSILVIEDFDSAMATKARRSMKKKSRPAVKAGRLLLPAEDENEETPLSDLFSGGLTLSGILNALDGIVSLDGKLVFMTTNVYEVLDPALVRKGRVDYTYELPLLTDVEVREYIRVMFPGQSLETTKTFGAILGCDLQDLYFQHHDCLEHFVASIPETAPPL